MQGRASAGPGLRRTVRLETHDLKEHMSFNKFEIITVWAANKFSRVKSTVFASKMYRNRSIVIA